MNSLENATTAGKAPKLMQIHCLYEPYLHQFYAARPGLETKLWQEQIDTCLNDYCAGTHMFAPYLKQFGWDTQLVIANCWPAQMQWLREQGFGLHNQNNWALEIALGQVEIFKPDVLYLSHPIDFDARFLSRLTWKPNLVMGWRAARVNPDTDWHGFDLMLSHLSSSRDLALTLGAKNVQHFHPGFPEKLAQQLIGEQKKYDVVFSGQWSDDHQRRNSFIEAVADQVASGQRNYKLGYFLACLAGCAPSVNVQKFDQGPLWGLAMHQALRQGKIVLNAEISIANGEAGNMRLFEVTGSGSFLLTEHHDNIGQYFTPGVEIETYKNSAEMLEKIDFYLKNDSAREAIARRGQERCLTQYGMDSQCKKLIEIIRTQKSGLAQEIITIPKDKQVMTQETSCMQETRAGMLQALEYLAFSNPTPALDLLIKAKANKQVLRDLDYTRALCFGQLNRLEEVRESLREELRFFPDNTRAQALLVQVQKDLAQRGTQILEVEDPEFNLLLDQIRPYTMVPVGRLYSLFSLAKQVCQNDMPGNFVECGVAGGGSSGLLSALIKRYSKRSRLHFAFDSFSGMPKPTAMDTHQGQGAEETGWGTGTCAAPEDSVKEICQKLGSSDILRTVKGYFEETLAPHREEIGTIAFLHLDGDWYESTKAILENLYDQVTPGGVLQIDDYGHWDGCKRAINEFAEKRGLNFQLQSIDGAGAWFQKPY